jgi:hypothetical protein
LAHLTAGRDPSSEPTSSLQTIARMRMASTSLWDGADAAWTRELVDRVARLDERLAFVGMGMPPDFDAAKALLDAGANPNAKVAGYTPLHWAVPWGDVRIVRALLRAGANPNIPDPSGRRPLDKALEFGHSDVVRVLLDAGAR